MKLDICSTTVWRKPAGAPDTAFERFGDFADDGAAMRYLSAEMLLCRGYAYKLVPALISYTQTRTPLPSEGTSGLHYTLPN